MINPEDAFRIDVPHLFSFGESLSFLNRNVRECLHKVDRDRVLKLLPAGGNYYLAEISADPAGLVLRFPQAMPPEQHMKELRSYLKELFDLDADLEGFYRQVGKDRILGELVCNYAGLRLIGMPDLFEALCWAIIGQQINLSFAYTLKRNLVQATGYSLEYAGEKYYAFPEPAAVRACSPEMLLAMQFSRRKVEYIMEIARQFEEEGLSKESLLALGSREAIVQRLISIRGVGMWTAEYVLMKCLKYYDAFPIADIGLQNALKQMLGSAEKPGPDEIRKLAAGWKGWESYATFYLWRSLIV